MITKKLGGEVLAKLDEDGRVCLEIHHEGEIVAGIGMSPENSRALGIDLIKLGTEGQIIRDQAAKEASAKEEGEDYGRIG